MRSGLTPFAAVVEVSRLVTETSSRSRKIAILAELLGAVDAEEVSPCVGFLSGLPRQGRVGVGYSAVYGVRPASGAGPSLTVADVERAISEIEATVGPGEGTRRRGLRDGRVC